jgi:hypothetical protein
MGEILETVGVLFPTLFPTRLGPIPAFAFGMTCGAEKGLLSIHFQNSIP